MHDGPVLVLCLGSFQLHVRYLRNFDIPNEVENDVQARARDEPETIQAAKSISCWHLKYLMN